MVWTGVSSVNGNLFLRHHNVLVGRPVSEVVFNVESRLFIKKTDRGSRRSSATLRLRSSVVTRFISVFVQTLLLEKKGRFMTQ